MSEMHICSHDALFGCRCDCTVWATVMSRYPALVPASLSLTDLFLKPITDKPEVVTGWCHGWPRGTTPGMEDNQLRRAERAERTWNRRGGRCIKNKKKSVHRRKQPASRQTAESRSVTGMTTSTLDSFRLCLAVWGAVSGLKGSLSGETLGRAQGHGRLSTGGVYVVSEYPQPLSDGPEG